MKLISSSLAVLLLLFSATSAWSCTVRLLTLEERISEASAIYIGQVTAVHIPELEKHQNYIPLLALSSADRNIRINIHRNIKGNDIKLLNVVANTCTDGAGAAELGEKVIVFFGGNDRWYFVVGDENIRKVTEHSLNEKP